MCLQGQLCVFAERPGCFGTCLNSCDTDLQSQHLWSLIDWPCWSQAFQPRPPSRLLATRLTENLCSKSKISVSLSGMWPRLAVAPLWYARLSRRETLLCLVLEFVFLLNRSAVSSFWIARRGGAEFCSVWGRRDAAEEQHPAKCLRDKGKKKQVFMLILAAALPNVVPGSYRRSQNKAQL